MSKVYFDPDWEVVDYQTYVLDPDVIDSQNKTEFLVRGPRPIDLKPNKYIICIGAAQTFGRFCDKPYPTLLQEKLDIEVLNLGRGGAGPSFFINLQNHEIFLQYLNNAKFVIIQILSGRSENNSLYDSGGLGLYTRRSDGATIKANDAYKELLKNHDRAFVAKIVAETRNNWLNNFQYLLKEIKVPKILFWFAERKPSYREQYTSFEKLWGAFPHMVNQKMINQLKTDGDHYIECVTSRGKPQKLISRFTGQPTTIVDPGQVWTHNNYYPTPEMHIDAANSLENICRSYLSSNNYVKRRSWLFWK